MCVCVCVYIYALCQSAPTQCSRHRPLKKTAFFKLLDTQKKAKNSASLNALAVFLFTAECMFFFLLCYFSARFLIQYVC